MNRSEVGVQAWWKPAHCAMGCLIPIGEWYAVDTNLQVRPWKMSKVTICATHFKAITGLDLRPWDHPEGDDCKGGRRG